MQGCYAYIVFFILSAFFAFSQKKVPTQNVKQVKQYKKTILGIGAGVTRSVVYLSRNVKPDNDATGISTSLVYGGSKLFRASLEYTHYGAINIEPTWYGVRANTLELNMHVLARFKGKNAFFYPLFGLSYNTFSGIYTGINDYLNLRSLHEVDTRVVTRWLGVNIGTGYEIYFKPGSFFIDYKMRVGITEGQNKLNIQDVCISAGLRLNLKVPSLYGIFVYKGVRSRYLLDTSEEY